MADTYKALTRKYRPKSFEDIVSQQHVRDTLRNAMTDGRLSHAYLFTGPRGVGKTTMARVLARLINGVDADVDGEALGNTLDIIEIDAASNNKVEDVHFLRDTVRVPPQTGTHKVYIIDEVHMLSKSAFNALLKTLEEPPPYVVFIFATTEPHKLPATVLSRCQRFDFRRIKVSEIVARLKHICKEEAVTIDDEALHVIASRADGALRDALSLLDQAIAFCGTTITEEALVRALNVVSTERLFAFMEQVAAQDTPAGMILLDDLLLQGHDLQEILGGLMELLRNLYLARDQKNLYLIEVTEETMVRYRKVTQRFSADDLLRMLHLVGEAQVRVRDATQPRIVVEVLWMKLLRMPRTEGLQELLAALRGMPAAGPPAAAGPTHVPKAAPAAPAAPQPARQTRVVDDGDVLGAPAIRRPKALHAVDLDGVAAVSGGLEGSLAVAMAPEPEPESAPEALYLHDVQARWDEWLARVMAEAGKMMHGAAAKARPVDLNGERLLVEVPDRFTEQVLQQNQRLLSGVWKSLIRHHLYLDVRVVESGAPPKADDPYTRFKQLQKQNPKLRMLVDLLGAELDYS